MANTDVDVAIVGAASPCWKPIRVGGRVLNYDAGAVVDLGAQWDCTYVL
jgi:hypothetical protein